jgi:hypothetical protein
VAHYLSCTPTSNSDITRKTNSPCNSWIPIDPPGSSDTTLSIEDAELVEPKLILQPTRNNNARRARSDDQDRIVRVRIVVVAVNSFDRLAHFERSRQRNREAGGVWLHKGGHLMRKEGIGGPSLELLTK